MPLVKIHDGDIITIGLNRKKRPQAAGGKPKGGPIRKKRGVEFYPRRLVNQKIRFFDTGYRKVSGDIYEDLPFNHNPGWTVGVLAGKPNITGVQDFGLDSWQELWDLIFEIPLEDWSDNYYEIKKEDDSKRFGVSVYQGRGGILETSTKVDHANQLGDDNPDWTDDGLKSLNDWAYVQPTGGLAMSFDTFDTAHYKVTDTFDFDAPDVGINFSNGAEVYLIPQPSWSSINQTIAGAVNADYRQEVVYGHWGIKPRTLFLDKTFARFTDDSVEIPIFEGYYAGHIQRSAGDWMYSFQYLDDPFAAEIQAWIESQPLAEWIRRTAFTGSVYAGPSAPPSGIPHPGNGPTDYVNVQLQFDRIGDQAYFAPGEETDLFTGPGMLCAVVKVSSGWRYIWRQGSGRQSEFWPNLGYKTPPEEF